MPKSKKTKFYAVANGRKPGIYETWDMCKAQVNGFSDARYKGFATKSEALKFMGQKSTSTNQVSGKKRPGAQSKTNQATSQPQVSKRPRTNGRQAVTSGQPGLTIAIHFDGGSRGNPGYGGSGTQLVVTDSLTGSEKTIHIRKYMGTVTNNVAEYEGLLCGLRETKLLVRNFTGKQKKGAPCPVNVHVRGDSQLIIKQLNGVYQCKNKNILPSYTEAKSLVAEMERDGNVHFSFEHVYRNENQVADALANEAMDTSKSWTTITKSGSESKDSDASDSVRITEV